MAFSYKVLGQNAPSVTTDVDVYTVPAATEAVVSTIAVCNFTNAASTFTIAIRPAGAVKANLHYIAKDVAIAANDTVFLTIGATLAATDVVTIQTNTADSVSFNVYGSEITA